MLILCEYLIKSNLILQNTERISIYNLKIKSSTFSNVITKKTLNTLTSTNCVR